MPLPYVTSNQAEKISKEVAKEVVEQSGGSMLPEITPEDSGKILGVSEQGQWELTEQGGGTTVVANPTLAGTEEELEGLQVGETKYKVPSGGSSDSDYSKVIESEDAITFEIVEDGLIADAPNFKNFFDNKFNLECGEEESFWWWRTQIEKSTGSAIQLLLPQDYKFTIIYKNGEATTCSAADGKDIGKYPNANSTYGSLAAWNYGYRNLSDEYSITIEATDENDADIVFNFPNGCYLTYSVSIETDFETGDAWLVFPDYLIYQPTEEEQYDGSNVEKVIVWRPSSNPTHVTPDIHMAFSIDLDGHINYVQRDTNYTYEECRDAIFNNYTVTIDIYGGDYVFKGIPLYIRVNEAGAMAFFAPRDFEDYIDTPGNYIMQCNPSDAENVVIIKQTN